MDLALFLWVIMIFLPLPNPHFKSSWVTCSQLILHLSRFYLFDTFQASAAEKHYKAKNSCSLITLTSPPSLLL